MDGEFNNLDVENTNITFSVDTDNIATSDETSADPIYQNQMGTIYARGKKVGKAVSIVGITLAFTAAAIGTGSVLSNAFVPKPPVVTNPVVEMEGDALNYSFTIENVRNYKTTYYIELNGKEVLAESCTEPMQYSGSYSPIESGTNVKFYIKFTNSLDYFKTIYTKTFVA